MAKVNITSPVGRIVMGSLYEPNTTDAEGKPLVVKNGPNVGQPRVNYFFAQAIPKAPGQTHWAMKPPQWDIDRAAEGRPGFPYWGEQIWNVGNQAFPGVAQSPAFAWKIEDGDSQIPNKKGRKPCENEGWPGHWILKFSGGFAPKVYQQDGAGYVQVMQKDFCKPGYFVEVAFSVDGNGSQSQPGVYLNHSMVCFRAYGQEIQFGPDVASAGFGGGVLPQGASVTPPAGAIPMPQAPAAAPAPLPLPSGIPQMPGTAPAPLPLPSGIPQMPGTAPAPLPQGGSVPMPSTPAPIPVVPNPQFVQVPPPAPIAPPTRQMTAAAQGVPYESYIARGWTDALLVQQGMMLV